MTKYDISKITNPLSIQTINKFARSSKESNNRSSTSTKSAPKKSSDYSNASNFNEAFKIARKELGDGKVFKFNGKLYTTALASTSKSVVKAVERQAVDNKEISRKESTVTTATSTKIAPLNGKRSFYEELPVPNVISGRNGTFKELPKEVNRTVPVAPKSATTVKPKAKINIEAKKVERINSKPKPLTVNKASSIYDPSNVSNTSSPKPASNPELGVLGSIGQYAKMAKNGVSRYISKNYGGDDESVSKLEIPKKHTNAPSSYITGDTINSKKLPGRYFLPESIDMNNVSLGVRNRGDLKDVDTEAGLVTAFNPFAKRSTVKVPKGSYIGVDANGKLKAGDISEFGDDDMVSKTVMNRVTDFNTIAGKVDVQKRSKKNSSNHVPVVNVLENGRSIKGSLNLLTGSSSKRTDTYGDITGGRVLLKSGNNVKLISGSIDDVKRQFDAFKSENKASYVDVYAMDNGTYNTAIRTKNKKITKNDWIDYDAQNDGGGNVLYVKSKDVNNVMNNGMAKRAYGGIIPHAYGSTIRTKWNAGDVGSVAVSTGSGILSGLGAGAAMGSIGGPWGMAIGGTIGLISGLLGSSGKAKARAQAKESNRQQTIANMESRTEADANEANFRMPNSAQFYLNGGKLRAAGGMVRPGMEPISHDTEFGVGPRHEKGGIPYGPKDVIEGGETTKKTADGTMVFSDRLTVPGTNKTYAEVSMPIMQAKAELEKQFSKSESSISKEKTILDDGKESTLSMGSAKRRAMIGASKSNDILVQIDELDKHLDQLFQLQEQANGNAQEGNEEGQDQQMMNPDQQGVEEHGYGDFIPYDSKIGGIKLKSFNGDSVGGNVGKPNLDFWKSDFKLKGITDNVSSKGGKSGMGFADKFGSSQIMYQAGSDVLDTVGQAINSYQMSRLPVPVRSKLYAPKLNNYIDNSGELNDINASGQSTMKFIKDNTSNPSIRRASIMSVMNRVNAAKSSAYLNKLKVERDIEGQNTMLGFRVNESNNNAVYQNSVDKYNAANAANTRSSQITANFSDKVQRLGSSKAQLESNDMALGAIISQLPASVRKTVLDAMSKGSSYRNALRMAQ